MSINNSNGIIGNRTRNLPTCSCATAHRARRHPYLSHVTCSRVPNNKAECFSILYQQVHLHLCVFCGSKKEQRLFTLQIINLLIFVTKTSDAILTILEYCAMLIGKYLWTFRKGVVPLVNYYVSVAYPNVVGGGGCGVTASPKSELTFKNRASYI
jgi:hypothetical protein